jgi:LuxR family maltose regulon positive regulatory protein
MSQAENQSRFLQLATRFVPPQLPEALVRRERLLKDLDTAAIYRLVLLSASAGSGKTTLLSTWAESVRRAGQKVAWLSLDEMDNDPTRFWIAIIAALRTGLPTFGEAALTLLRSPQPVPVSALLASLLNELLEDAGEWYLLVDDYQVIEEKTIHEAFTFLIDRLPANLHLVLASRCDPDLPLARWRTRGQLLELRDPDLSFTPDETGMFLTRTLAFSVSTQEASRLQQRTEGWIAGLQLAALALRRHEDYATFLRAFTGNHRYLMDYVQQEVLTALPESLHTFLLQIAVLPRMNADLCQAVTGEANSQEFLEMLERQNLFLIPLDEERRWYRLHDLFREVLLARLQLTSPEQVPVLRKRAASFYVARGEVREAVVFALAAQDFSSAATLMEQAIEELWLRGETQTLYRWMIALPDAVVISHARMLETAVLFFLNTPLSTSNELRLPLRMQAEQILRRVEFALHNAGEQALLNHEMRVYQRRLHLLRLYRASLEAIARYEIEQLRILEQQMLQLERDEEILWQMIPLSVTFILIFTYGKEGWTLIPRLMEAKQRLSLTHNRFATLKVMQWLALILQDAGQLHQAYRMCQEALTLLREMEGHVIWGGYFLACQIDILHAWHRLDEIPDLLKRMISEATLWQHPDLYTWGCWKSVLYELAVGNLANAQHYLQEIKRLQQEQVAKNYTNWTSHLQVKYWLTARDLAAASAWAARVVVPEDDWNPLDRFTYLLLAEIYCARGEYARAVALLAWLRVHIEQLGDHLRLISVYALSFMALHHEGKQEQARCLASHLFTLTEPEGFLSIYLEQGEPMRQALQTLLDTPSSGADFSRSYVSTLLLAFERERLKPAQKVGVVPSNHLAVSEPGAIPGSPTALIEPLSPQERRVLRLLVAGRSNPEIASELVVSVNTVKTQVQSIYRKLGVANRVEASAVARDLQIL